MTSDFAQLLADLPPRPARSRLEPYRPLIDELRRRGWSFRAIVALLAEKVGVRTSVSNLHHFVIQRQTNVVVRKRQGVGTETDPESALNFEFDEALPLKLR